LIIQAIALGIQQSREQTISEEDEGLGDGEAFGVGESPSGVPLVGVDPVGVFDVGVEDTGEEGVAMEEATVGVPSDGVTSEGDKGEPKLAVGVFCGDGPEGTKEGGFPLKVGVEVGIVLVGVAEVG
jgi:hypothetical protein